MAPEVFQGGAETGEPRASDAAAAIPGEREVVDALLRHDRKAAAEFVAAHTDAVFAYVRHRLAPRLDRVDDVVQDVFVAAFAGLRSYRGTSPLRAWLLGIARHKIEDFYRQRLREPEELAEPGDPAEPAAGEELPIEDRIDRARAAERTHLVLTRLPEAYSVALLWRYWENRSVREIAEASGKTEKAIERLLARAREKFRELWTEVSHG